MGKKLKAQITMGKKLKAQNNNGKKLKAQITMGKKLKAQNNNGKLHASPSNWRWLGHLQWIWARICVHQYYVTLHREHVNWKIYTHSLKPAAESSLDQYEEADTQSLTHCWHKKERWQEGMQLQAKQEFFTASFRVPWKCRPPHLIAWPRTSTFPPGSSFIFGSHGISQDVDV